MSNINKRHWKQIPIEVLVETLKSNDYNILHTAEQLRISPSTVNRKLKKYKIDLPQRGRHARYTFSNTQLLDALFKSNGVVTSASKLLGCASSTFKHRMNKDPEFQNEVYRIRVAHDEHKKDEYEAEIAERRKKVLEPDTCMMKGYLYEQLWATECMRRNLLPHTNSCPKTPHDNILYSCNNYNTWKVQLKGTSYQPPRNQAFSVQLKKIHADKFLYGNGKRKPVNATKVTGIDIIGAYVAPHDVWYIIPIKALTSRVMALYPHNTSSNAQFEQYKNNWSIFE